MAPLWWSDKGVIAANATPNDYAALNLGQAKTLFSFDVAYDSDGDGTPDWQETTQSAVFWGLTNQQAFALGYRRTASGNAIQNANPTQPIERVVYTASRIKPTKYEGEPTTTIRPTPRGRTSNSTKKNGPWTRAPTSRLTSATAPSMPTRM